MIVYSSRTTQDPLDRFMAAYADMDADKVDVDHSGSYEFLHLEGLERAKAFMEKFIKFGDQFSSPDDDFSSPFLSLKFWSVIFPVVDGSFCSSKVSVHPKCQAIDGPSCS